MRETQLSVSPLICCISLKLVFVLVVAGGALGCVPMRYTSGPASKGRVVDADSKVPIKNAFVTLTRAKGAAAQTSTSKDGEFHIRSRHGWYMLNLLHSSDSKPILQPAVLTIDAGSYLSFATNSHPGATMLDVGEVRLQPLPK